MGGVETERALEKHVTPLSDYTYMQMALFIVNNHATRYFDLQLDVCD